MLKGVRRVEIMLRMLDFINDVRNWNLLRLKNFERTGGPTSLKKRILIQDNRKA